MLGPSAHIDTFTHDTLPPPDRWPDLLLGGFDYSDRINAGVELTDRLVEKGFGDHSALIGKRQKGYVRDGRNLTGDAFYQDETGFFHLAARSYDMIVSAGYSIASPEVEVVLLSHPDMAIVKRPHDDVKAKIAPYRYPRSVTFIDALPKTQTGKIQRFRHRGETIH